MSVRLRGLLVTVGCALLAGALLWLVNGVLLHGTGARVGGAVKWLLALPVVGMGIGLIELATGLPIHQADAAWQAAPVLVKYPAAIVGGGLFLWAFLWVVAKALGA